MWTRLNEIERMFDAMDAMHTKVGRFFPGHERIKSLPAAWHVTQAGPVSNLYDMGDHLEMVLEVPGMDKNEINVKLQGNYLEVTGKRKSDTPDGYTAHRVERGVSSFSRSFTLPFDIDSSKVEANLNNGLLKLILPKSEAAKPKQIAIN